VKKKRFFRKMIGIKVGTSIVTKMKGVIDEVAISEICRQCAELVEDGNAVFIVTSGAVASGYKEGRSKNLCSAVGQSRLMNIYTKHFAEYGMDVSQHLFTDQELLAKDNKVTKNTLLEAMTDGIVPIINANDSVDSFELGKIKECADNDQLLALVSKLIGADMVIIGFSENGFRDGEGNIIRRIRSGEIEKFLGYAKGGSALGHGKNGMRTKLLMLNDLSENGIVAMLAPGKEKNFILRSAAKEKDFGTLFVK